MTSRFTLTFTAGPEHIDQMGHVNNAVWVQWMEAIATAHWEAVAPPEHQAEYLWVVTRHEIDYRGNIREGESVTAETFIPDGPNGARFDRCVEFRNGQGKVIVRSRTTWAMIARATGRVMRIPDEVAARFTAG
ncbi:acyl-CoA thioesterase [Novosphingobium mangrovi (ex Huang et al. 2023)]|uniref:Acyl-CoA thioesterase n=1 Tax=Novosphingobium mangrovi (ex Huang et al. 2023) TaxID=2976432 RepID=A0ABT2I370_9SPHN|nr:acyl-CoA thioesterase [Novosphingobium mangrovi (ex Huang et al. 2023)]MCT2399246.1 acyl-CoA thioesterase [Novosphingobium mangrovi (ex Huang et al. 2023)]